MQSMYRKFLHVSYRAIAKRSKTVELFLLLNGYFPCNIKSLDNIGSKHNSHVCWENDPKTAMHLLAKRSAGSDQILVVLHQPIEEKDGEPVVVSYAFEV